MFATWQAAIAMVVILGCACSYFFQPRRTALPVRLRYLVGVGITMNFLAFWAFAFVFMGGIYKQWLIKYLFPIFDRIDRSPALRKFAQEWIYEKPHCADYFATQFLFVIQFVIMLGAAIFCQLTLGTLPWWFIIAYNFAWVGMGGRAVGALYAVSHREGHNLKFYKPWIRNTFGNVFENWIGCFYGSVPYNFSTAHVSLHHRLDAGMGDTLYCWDFNRCSWVDCMPYLCRSLLHFSGFGGLYQFLRSQRKFDRANATKLAWGAFIYWMVLPKAVISLSASFSFYMFIVLQPLLCLSFFLALINQGFHSFIENDEKGNRIQCVESITLLDGMDDYFGEDDHMAHHNAGHVYFTDLPAYQSKQRSEWAKHKASVFQGYDIITFSVCVLMKAWPLLAARYIDYSGEMTQKDIETLLEARARRREMEHTSFLPAAPASKANGYQKDPGCASRDDKAPGLHGEALRKLAVFQLWIASQMEKGLPPVKAYDTRMSLDSIKIKGG